MKFEWELSRGSLHIRLNNKWWSFFWVPYSPYWLDKEGKLHKSSRFQLVSGNFLTRIPREDIQEFRLIEFYKELKDSKQYELSDKLRNILGEKTVNKYNFPNRKGKNMNDISNKDMELAQDELKKLEATPVQTPADVGEETPETRVN